MPQKHDESQVILALQAMQNDKNLSARAAGKIYHVDHENKKLQGGGFELKTVKTVRLAAGFLNTEAVVVSIGAEGVDELLNTVDGDGVFRGGGHGPRSQPPGKGGAAPKKQL